MVNFVALDSTAHRAKRVMTAPSARFGDNLTMVGVVPREFARLVAHYPIFLRKNNDNGLFEPGALLGFSANENLFLEGERWDSAYVPLHIQSRPFRFLKSEGGRDGVERNGLAVAIDMDSPRVQDDEGEVMFLEGGKASDYLDRIVAILSELVAGTRAAHHFAAKLADLDLIESVRIDVEFLDGSETKLQGLYSVSRERLARLGGHQLAELRDLGFLELVYFMLASMGHISALVARRNRRMTGA